MHTPDHRFEIFKIIMHLLSAASILLGIAAAYASDEFVDGIYNPDPKATSAGESDAEFNKDLFEGDMIMKKKPSEEDRNAFNDPNKLWPRGVVPYTFHSRFAQSKREVVKKAIADYSAKTCIKFVPRRNEKDYIEISDLSSGCSSWYGRQGTGKQTLYLGSSYCIQKGVVIHEMLHALGFAHEQARNDRDKYIRINWGNIYKSRHSQYTKLGDKEKDLGSDYDYNSVMHYPALNSFSSNGKDGITTLDSKYQKVIGQRRGFSETDLKEVNKLYKCNGKTSGIGGSNGGGSTSGGSTSSCVDKNASYCANIKAKYAYSCKHKNTYEYCPKSCGKC